MNNMQAQKTEANLRAAFAGESQARNQYTFFGVRRKKRVGYEQMAALFLKTAETKKEHAKLCSRNCPASATQRPTLRRCRRRKLRMDRHVSGLCQDCRRKGFLN